MRFNELRRTTTFRLTILYGALFALGTIALLWMVYIRSIVYMTARVDHIIDIQTEALLHSPRPGLRAVVDPEHADDRVLEGLGDRERARPRSMRCLRLSRT